MFEVRFYRRYIAAYELSLIKYVKTNVININLINKDKLLILNIYLLYEKKISSKQNNSEMNCFIEIIESMYVKLRFNFFFFLNSLNQYKALHFPVHTISVRFL